MNEIRTNITSGLSPREEPTIAMANRLMEILIIAFAIQEYVHGKPAQKTHIELMADNVKTLADNVSKSLGLQDVTSEKVLNTINDQAKALADNLKAIQAQVDKEVKAHEGDVRKTLKEFEDGVAKTVESIAKIVDPGKKVQKSAEEIRAQFDASFRTVADSFDKLAKKLQPEVEETKEKVEKLYKTIVEKVVEVGKDTQVKLDRAVQDHQKTHKH